MLIFALSLVGMLATGSAQQVMSQRSCACQTECASRISVFNLNFDHPACRIDRSVCGECPQSRCVGGVRVCAFGRCTTCVGGSVQCYDNCVPPSGANTIVGNTIAAARSLAQTTIDDFNALSNQVQDIIAEEIRALPPPLQQLLSNATLFARASINDLRQIGQDVLANVREVRGLARAQIRGLIERLVDFTVENLESFISHLNITVWRESLEDFGCISRWSPEQYAVLADRAVFALGSTIGWTPTDVRRLGSLVRGVSAGNISQLSPLAYEATLLTLSTVSGGTVSRTTGDALAQRAIAVYHEVSGWNETQWRLVGSVARGLSEGDLAGVSITALREVARVRGWNQTQELVLVERIITLLGNTDNVSASEWQEVAQLAGGIATTRIQHLSTNGVYALGRGSCAIGGVCPSRAQSEQIVTRATQLIGDVRSWDAADWRRLGQNIRGLSVQDIRGVTAASLSVIAQQVDLDLGVLDATQLRAIATRSIELLGSLDTWSLEDSRSHVSLFVGMLPAQLSTMSMDQVEVLADFSMRHPGTILSAAQLQAIGVRFRTLTAGRQWTEADIRRVAALATAFQGDVPTLDRETLLTLAQMLTNVSQHTSLNGTSLSVDPALVSTLATRAVAVLGPIEDWESSNWGNLGAVAQEVLFRNLTSIIGSNTSRNSAILTQITGLSAHQRRSIRDVLVQAYGSAGQVPWAEFGDIAVALSTGDLNTASVEVLDLLSTVGSGECVQDVPCDPTYGNWNISILGAELCPRQLLAIGRRAVHFFGELHDWDATSFARMGPLLRGLNEADISDLPEVAFDYIGNVSCWNVDQLKCLSRRAVQVVQGGQGIASWSERTWERLGEVPAGFDIEVFRSMSRTTFERATVTLGRSTLLSPAQLEILAARAVEVYGPASTWSAETVSRLGTLLAGLVDDQIMTIPAQSLATGLANAPNSTSLLPGPRPTSSAVTTLCAARKIHLFTPEQAAEVHVAGVDMMASGNCPSEASRYTEAQAEALQARSGQNTNGSDGDAALSPGATAAIVLVVLALLAAVVAVVVYRARNESYTASNSHKSVPNLQGLEAGTSVPTPRPPKPSRPPPVSAASERPPALVNPVYNAPTSRPPPRPVARVPPPRAPTRPKPTISPKPTSI